MEQWYLIYCKPQQDNRAEQNLLRQGFNAFRPTVVLTKNSAGKAPVLKRESLFPRYIFVRINPYERALAPISSTFGVADFVKFGDTLAIVPEHLVEGIRINNEEQMKHSQALEQFQSGNEVQIVGHGFDQVKAIYANPSGEKRTIILMNILGKESRLIVPNQCVKKVPN